ncbi:hypothetical protein GCM10023322_44270 [Rugosimonospora acidiphila]|uniref:DUF2207 domain-containing protein n=1 Tax=Rugosimonospora acidiphila TaxID=556531 RepID=A0ABP9S130_9ACTN
MLSQVTLAIFAGCSLAAWLAAFWLAHWATRARVRADPAAPADEFEADPAVAALLCPPDGSVPRSAATAVLWDLAARGVLTAWLDRNGQCWVRPTADRGTLTGYERHVLRHVTSRAVTGSGVAPALALSLPSGEHERRWHAEFADLVVRDARARGLVAARAPLAARVLLGLAVLVPVGFATAAARHGDWHGDQLGTGLAFSALAGLALLSWMGRALSRPVPKGHGRAVAAQCLALRARLSAEPRTSPPAPGDRLPGYSVALAGAAPGPLSLVSARRDKAWSSRDGEWRPVRVHALRRSSAERAPGPVLMVFVALGVAVLLGAWLLLLNLLTHLVVPDRLGSVWEPAALAAGWLLWCAGVWRAGVGLYREVYDRLRPHRIIVGQVVHVEYQADSESTSFAIAVDDGTGDDIPLYQVDPSLYRIVGYGSRVRMELMPKTRRTVRVDLVPAPGATIPGRTDYGTAVKNS